MSNLGSYQLITSWSKKVGGPFVLLFLAGVSGHVVLKGVEEGVKGIVKVAKNHKNNKSQNLRKYVVKKEGISNEGVLFKAGDEFRVLEMAEDAILIELMGADDNPYFVDINLLTEISDYRQK